MLRVPPDPAPVAQTFFIDEELRERYILDGIITLVDAKHAELHLTQTIAQAQVGFADRLLLSKTDLVDAATFEATGDPMQIAVLSYDYTVLAGTHPDVTVLATEAVSYRIEDVRALVESAEADPVAQADRGRLSRDRAALYDWDEVASGYEALARRLALEGPVRRRPSGRRTGKAGW